MLLTNRRVLRMFSRVWLLLFLTLLTGCGIDVELEQGKQAARPESTVSGGQYESAITVGLSSQTPNAEIYYTLDGTEPILHGSLYSSPINIFQNTILRAKAKKSALVIVRSFRSRLLLASKRQ